MSARPRCSCYHLSHYLYLSGRLEGLPKHVPQVRSLHHENQPDRYVPGVPFQTAIMSTILPRPPSSPTFDTPYSRHARHPISSLGESASSVGARKAEPKEKLASTRKVASVRLATLKDLSLGKSGRCGLHPRLLKTSVKDLYGLIDVHIIFFLVCDKLGAISSPDLPVLILLRIHLA